MFASVPEGVFESIANHLEKCAGDTSKKGLSHVHFLRHDLKKQSCSTQNPACVVVSGVTHKDVLSQQALH